MKTKILSVLVALLLVGGGFAACNDSAATRAGELPDGIKPVVLEGEAGKELNAFFDDSNLWLTARSVFGTAQLIDTCVMIDSMEEFQAIDFPNDIPPLELPTIDFDAYTLVIGQYVGGYSQYISAQYLVVEQNVSTINLIITEKEEGAYVTVVLPVPFWGLYPKIAAKSTGVNVVSKN